MGYKGMQEIKERMKDKDKGTTNICSVDNHSSDDTVPCATRL
jgi:hypothetical protein